MEAARASKTSVNFCQTARRNIPEEGHFQMSSKLNQDLISEFIKLVFPITYVATRTVNAQASLADTWRFQVKRITTFREDDT
jgi:hypothetical protein